MKKMHILAVMMTLALTVSACGKLQTGKEADKLSPSPTTVTDTKPAETKSPVVDVKPKFTFTGDEGGTITKVDLGLNKVVDTIKVEGSIHNVQVSPDGKVLGATLVPKAAGHEGHAESKGLALFYDTATNQLIKKIEVGNHPAHIVFTQDQQYALVTNNEDNTVSVIDTKTYQTKGTIPTGKGPHGFRISADSKTAYVANMGEDSVSVLDLGAMKEIRKIKVGKTPVTTGVTSDGKWMVVTLNSENAAAIVDLQSDKVDIVPVGNGPAQVYIQSDNQVAIVANQGTEKSPSNSISKIDLATKKVVATIETGKGAHGVVTSVDNKWIYVTNMFEDTISVVDNVQNKEVMKIPVGDVPNGISLVQ